MTTKDPKEPRTKCIEWTGSLNPGGYGTVSVNGKTVGVHRLSWALANGRMPKKKMDICHKCDNRKCINPDHLFEGTRSDNMKDAVAKGRQYSANKYKTHCMNGHDFSIENTRIRPSHRRECIICKRKADKDWRDRNGK